MKKILLLTLISLCLVGCGKEEINENQKEIEKNMPSVSDINEAEMKEIKDFVPNGDMNTKYLIAVENDDTNYVIYFDDVENTLYGIINTTVDDWEYEVTSTKTVENEVLIDAIKNSFNMDLDDALKISRLEALNLVLSSSLNDVKSIEGNAEYEDYSAISDADYDKNTVITMSEYIAFKLNSLTND